MVRLDGYYGAHGWFYTVHYTIRSHLLPLTCVLNLAHCVENSFFLFFFKSFWRTMVPLFWISGDVSSGFQSQSGLPYSHCGGERNVRSPRPTVVPLESKANLNYTPSQASPTPVLSSLSPQKIIPPLNAVQW